MKTAVITFPASNCDRDAAMALEKVTGEKPVMVWHRERELPQDIDFVVLPGGFSYGDYLRCGAMASRSPIVKDLVAKANKGLAIAGFCNGFQVLTEAGLLPGALMRNKGLKFVCRPELEKQGQVVFRYADNPNGSARDIAGICNEAGNVFGMMPHPERAIDAMHGGTDGLGLFKSIIESI